MMPWLFEMPLHCAIITNLWHCKSCAFSKNVGYLWGSYDFFVPNYLWLCFEPKLRTLVACGCLVIYYFNLPKQSWKIGLSTYPRQPCSKRGCVWFWIEKVDGLIETSNFKGFFTFHLSIVCIWQEEGS